MTKSSERQEQSLTQAKIDPLRQGQKLDASDQKPKHDSSKTEVTLDAVMQEAEGKRGRLLRRTTHGGGGASRGLLP